jgi:hypothetical protein
MTPRLLISYRPLCWKFLRKVEECRKSGLLADKPRPRFQNFSFQPIGNTVEAVQWRLVNDSASVPVWRSTDPYSSGYGSWIFGYKESKQRVM